MKKSYQIMLLGVLVVGSFWGGGWYSQRGADNEQEVRRGGRVLYYVDPMNPTHTSDKPGLAPCGMPLEPVYAEEESSAQGSPATVSPMSPGTVKITPQKQQVIGVQVGMVEVATETHVIRTLGRVAPDENRVYRLISTIDGWMREVNESTTGSQVQKDQLMALLDVYKSDFYTWQHQHLLYAGRLQQSGTQTPALQQPGVNSHNAPSVQPHQAMQAQPRPAQPHHTQMAQPQTSEARAEHAQTDTAEAAEAETNEAEADQPETEQAEMNQSRNQHAHVMPVRAALPSRKVAVADYYADRAKLELMNLGIGEAQFEKLERTRQFDQYIEIRSPVTGFVLTRNISPRQWADKGTELFKIADLSHVWIVADVFAGEAPYIGPGVSARVSLPQQGEAFEATVSDVPPQFDPATRTLKVRLEAHNPENLLRPEMFVDVAFEITLPPAITVPADAVLDSGLRKTVFVDLGNGLFEPRTVQTGWRFDDRVEIVKGLQPGERIVVSGNFLIDSESRMKLAAAGFYGVPQKDPVCGADVYLNKAKAAGLTREYGGKTHYFCSEECKAQFAKKGDQPREMTAAVTRQQGAASVDKPRLPNAMAKDPVCGMMVNESKARTRGFVSEQEGNTHFFCSRECMEQFAGAPPPHMKQAVEGKSRPQPAGREVHRHD